MENLSENQISQFIDEGYVKLENAFSAEVARECRKILWEATGCDQGNRDSWTEPVIRIGDMGHEPFKHAANTTLLHNVFDQLVGKGNWIPRMSIGSFPIRFPCKKEATDTGWHVDSGFPGHDVQDINNYSEWRINIQSKGRALLMLFLFSDVSQDDAPTRIRAGSHFDIARILQPAGEEGLSFMELAQKLESSKERKEIWATGGAGTVFLCHPFIVHAAQSHYGETPKFMAQPPLHMGKEFNLKRADNKYCPVEKAILKGLE
jgi:Phytanoyl-CoA dioxygenase (PhyH)